MPWLHTRPPAPGAGVTQGLFYGVPEVSPCGGSQQGRAQCPPKPQDLQAMGHCEGSSTSPISSW